MSPVIMRELHEKIPLKISEWDEYSFIDHENGIIHREIMNDFGPDDIILLFTLGLSEDKEEGVLVVERLNAANNVEVCIGNVKFRVMTGITHAELQNGVQIESVYIDADYRTMGIALTSYEILLSHFNVISDTHQTMDGASLWKFKLAKQENIEVRVLNGFPKNISVMHDEDGADEIYTIDKSHLEPLIWGVESGASADRNHITYGYDTGRDKVVLIAKMQKIKNTENSQTLPDGEVVILTPLRGNLLT
ncbi:hypothetical protein [Aeromonas aquatica]|uniref:hypothetical protein n=1 Tax=Aeromonas aquatica TaxID=558964 RepID=UPI00286ECFD7|nr:hypothetical protein [Aeromonas aquatica]